MTRIPITPEGYQKLLEELKRLKNIERPKIIKEIAEARSHGDLSENAEYVAAKEKQGFIEGRIRELESKLALCEIIEIQENTPDRVVFGCVVVVEDMDDGKLLEFRIVGEEEADPRQGWISIQSPLGRALVGKEAGEEVEVRTPKGERVLRIVEIRSAKRVEESR
jgi:transcription elongation factor GreA